MRGGACSDIQSQSMDLDLSVFGVGVQAVTITFHRYL